MKKALSLILAILVVSLMLTACGESALPQKQTESAASAVSEEAMSSDHTEEAVANNDGLRSLVVYLDYSENIDTTGLDVDAITQASLRGGSTGENIENLKVMVNEIQNVKGADVFSIQVNEVYPPVFEDMTGIAKDDIANNKPFTFKNELKNLSDYDTIYIGVPVWWGELPQPVLVFFQQYDFSGKTIIPFGIHHGSGFGRMVNQMNEYEPNAVILDGFTIDADTANSEVRDKFDEFLSSL